MVPPPQIATNLAQRNPATSSTNSPPRSFKINTVSTIASSSFSGSTGSPAAVALLSLGLDPKPQLSSSSTSTTTHNSSTVLPASSYHISHGFTNLNPNPNPTQQALPEIVNNVLNPSTITATPLGEEIAVDLKLSKFSLLQPPHQPKMSVPDGTTSLSLGGIKSEMNPQTNSPTQQNEASTAPIRNTNLNEISKAVTTDCETTFQKSSFALKRTRSMGVFDASMRPNMGAELIGTMDDYPHLNPNSHDSTTDTSHLPRTSLPSPPATTAAPSPPPSIGYVSSTTLKPEAVDTNLPPSTHNSNIAPTLSTSSSSTIEDDEHGSFGSSSPSIPGTPELIAAPLDDSVIQYEPSRHVDYLSHNWKESDISSSWRYIVLRRKDMANSARLENASWRTWTKAKYNLKTVAPESVNWLKDYDVTWLYGPLYDEPHHTYSISPDNKSVKKGHGPGSKDNLVRMQEKSKNVVSTTSTAVSSTSTSRNTSPTHPHPSKPILKKRSVSQMMLSRPPLITHNSCNGTTSCNCSNHRTMTHEAANANHSSTGDGISTYLRHHNYRHRPHAGHSNENISHLVNQQYYHTPSVPRVADDLLLSPSISGGDSSSISSLNSNLQPTISNGSNGVANGVHPTTHDKMQPSPPPPQSQARHIHFNDRVEQCIAVNHAFSDDEDEDGDNKMSDRGRARSSSRHKKAQTQGRPQFGLGDDDDSDDSENDEESYADHDDYGYEEDDEEEDEEEEAEEDDDEEDDAGFFFMVRSASSASLHNVPKGSYRTIALLPATTLKYQVDETEREARQQAAANSVAFAMSHNTVNHRHAYSTYDYNSVYVSPAPSPSHSPSHSLSASYILQASTSSSASSTPIIPQTDTTNAVGELLNNYPVATSVLLDRIPATASSEPGSSNSNGISYNDMNVPESEFVEDTSTATETHIKPILSLGLQTPPSPTTKSTPTIFSNQVSVNSIDSSTPPSGNDENSATSLLEDNNRPKIGRLNSAVSSAKGLANSFWKSGWKQ